MNPLKYLVIHTTATPEGRWVSKEDVIRWHTSKPPVGLGWNRPGYNSLILLDGRLPTSDYEILNPHPDSIVQVLVPFNFDHLVQPHEVSFHTGPAYNPVSLSICYVGGITSDFRRPKDTRTDKQKRAMEMIIKVFISLVEKRGGELKILGHNQIHNKACPSFWVPSWLREIGIPEKYIDDRDPFGYKRFFRVK